MRPGEVDIEEKKKDSKTGYRWLLREKIVAEGSVRVQNVGKEKGERAYVKLVVIAAEPVEEEMSVDLANRKKGH